VKVWLHPEFCLQECFKHSSTYTSEVYFKKRDFARLEHKEAQYVYPRYKIAEQARKNREDVITSAEVLRMKHKHFPGRY